MAEVRLERVSKHFKETVAVDDLSLTVEEGEFFSLLGPSGCGKTTTLRMVGGFEEPTAGTVCLGGNDVTGLPANKRDVNTVFQSYALFPHLDVYENVAYGLKRKRVPDDQIQRRVAEMLDLVRMPGYERRRTTQLSGGQQQRIALARALVNQPEVLLLDEPLGALDLKLRKQMQLELKRIQQEVGITFIYVTHDQEEAMTMSERVGVMNAGKLEQIGPPRDVYETPATEFVASFLGASNLLDADIESIDGDTAKLRLRAGGTISVPSARVTSVRGTAGEHLKVGVRPEKLQIASGASGPAEASLDVTVVQSSYTGVGTSYSCTTADGTQVVLYVQNLDAGRAPLCVGEAVQLSWDPEHTFIIRPSTEGGDRSE